MSSSYVLLPSLRTDCTVLFFMPLSMLYSRLHKYLGDFKCMAGGRKREGKMIYE